MVVISEDKTSLKIETIEQKEQRELLNMTHEFGNILIFSEFEEIMNVYQKAIDRTMIEIRQKS